jgi:myo-inositol-1(or 4)-monophosphatase
MDIVKATIEANYELFNYLKTNQHNDIYEYTDIVGAGGDRSLRIDMIAEAIFVKHLGGYGKIVSEESGEIIKDDLVDSDVEIIIDPIDGSNNLIAKIPYYGSSVAFVKEGKTFASIICNLSNGDIFVKEDVALKANLNKLYFEELVPLPSPKVGIFERAYSAPDIVKKLHDNQIKFRSLGAMALSLSWAYNLDFVIGSGKIREYDVAAGLHICESLNIYQDKELIIISKDEQVFNSLKKILV